MWPEWNTCANGYCSTASILHWARCLYVLTLNACICSNARTTGTRSTWPPISCSPRRKHFYIPGESSSSCVCVYASMSELGCSLVVPFEALKSARICAGCKPSRKLFPLSVPLTRRIQQFNSLQFSYLLRIKTTIELGDWNAVLSPCFHLSTDDDQIGIEHQNEAVYTCSLLVTNDWLWWVNSGTPTRDEQSWTVRR